MTRPRPSTLLAVCIALQLVGNSTAAQEPDSLPALDPRPGAHHDPMMLVAMAGFVFTPGLLAVLPWDQMIGEEEEVFRPGRLRVRAEAGISSRGDSWSADAAHWVGAQLLLARVYVDAEISRLSALDSRHFLSVRAGYVWRPHPSAVGGAIGGVRRSSDGVHYGEIAFPLVSEKETGALRAEASYLVGPGCPCWNYRIEADFAVSPALRPGVAVTLRDIPREVGGQGFSVFLAWVIDDR